MRLRHRGRKTIYTDYSVIDDSNIREVIGKAMTVHLNNVADIKYLQDVDKGRQDILLRTKEVRPEINNTIVENHAHEIVEFKDGYVFGSPITYVQRAGKDIRNDESDEDIDDNSLQMLNEMLFEENKSSKDQELANTFDVCGIAYRGIFPQDDENAISCFKILNMNPRYTFVIRTNDIYKKVVAGVSYTIKDDLTCTFGVYTDDYYYQLSGEIFGVNLKIDLKQPNGIGVVPIIEYKQDYNKMGCFERGLPLLDAINQVTSDRVNGLDQFIQSLVWFNNIDIDEEQFAALSKLGGIKTKSVENQQPSIEVISTNLNQTETQTLVDYLYDQLLYICAVPGREQSTGGNTGLALTLGGSGWQLAETAAKKTEQLFNASERESLNVIAKIVEKSNHPDLRNIKVSDIEVKFSRNKISNLLTKTQGLLNQLTAGIHPRVAISNCDLYDDPETVYNDSKEFLDKWKTSSNNTNTDPNSVDGASDSEPTQINDKGGNDKVEEDSKQNMGDDEKNNGQ